MIYGVGTDLLHRATLREGCLTPSDPFFRAVYTQAEQEEGARRDSPADYFRTRFAGKEAVFKALRLHPSQLERWNQIEILTLPTGGPRVILHGALQLLAEARGVREIHLSLSYDGDYYQAFCVACAGDGQQTEKGADYE